MLLQKKQRENDKKQQELDRIAGKHNDSAGEVFVVAETPEDVDRIQSLNDAGTRRELNQRFKYIKDQGSVQEQYLPEVKRELTRQAAEQFKNSIRGK